MKPLVLSTAGRRGTAAGMEVISAGGNAVDAVIAAALVWPRALMSAGVAIALGTGLGRVACRFPARVPGFGLSRPKRLGLIDARAPASLVATSCAAPAMATLLARSGTMTLARVSQAARSAGEPLPHGRALEALEREGVDSFIRDVLGEEASRRLGPLEGGLLTRRDFIGARPALGEAHPAGDGLWGAQPLSESRREAGAGMQEPRHVLGVAAVDHRGAMAVAALDAGPRTDHSLAEVLGIPPNALLSDHPPSRIRKVGQPLPLRCVALAGGEVGRALIAGPTTSVMAMLDGEIPSGDLPGLFRVLLSPGGAVQVEGHAEYERG